MSLSYYDSDAIRRYLLGKLNDDEIAAMQQRLLTEDELFEESELIKHELVEEYLAKELTQDEARWLEQNFLASPEGKQQARFAKSLDRYVVSHLPAARKKNSGFTRTMTRLWNAQPVLLRAAAALAVVVILAVIFWTSRAPSPQTFATLTLVNTSSTRSSADEVKRIKPGGSNLRLTLMLPEATTPTARYRVERTNATGETKTFEVTGTEVQSVLLEIPAGELSRGAHVITLSTMNSDGTTQRIPGGYHFTVE